MTGTFRAHFLARSPYKSLYVALCKSTLVFFKIDSDFKIGGKMTGMSNFRLSFLKCPAVLSKLQVNILQTKFIRHFRRKFPRGKFTIVKGYYSSKELFIETFRLAVYPGNFSKNWQNPWSDRKKFSNTRRMRRIFSAHVQIFRGDLDLYEGYIFPTELPTLI